LHQPKFIVANWDNLDKFNVFPSCPFTHHLEEGKCLVNDGGYFSLGEIFIGNDTKQNLVSCNSRKDICDEDEGSL